MKIFLSLGEVCGNNREKVSVCISIEIFFLTKMKKTVLFDLKHCKKGHDRAFFQEYLMQVNESKGWCKNALGSGTKQQTWLVGHSHTGTPGPSATAFQGNAARNAHK